MNKIKLKLMSTQMFDETAIVDIFYNDVKVLSDITISSDGTECIFDVENNSNLYNNIKIFQHNFFEVPSEILDVKRDNDFNPIISTNLSYLEDITLFLYSVEISNNSGSTWVDVTPCNEKNPQNVSFEDETYIYSRVFSDFLSSTDHAKINKEIFGKDYCFIIRNQETDFWIPSIEKSNNITEIYINGVLLNDLSMNKVKKRNSIPIEYEYVSLTNQENFELIKSKFSMSQKKRYNKITKTLE